MAAIAIGLELEQNRPLARAHPFERRLGRAAHREHVHAVDLHAGDAEALAAAIELVLRAAAVDRGAHGVLVVLDHEDDRQLPQLGHVEAFVHLALVRGAVAEIRSEEHTSELQSLMRISYAVFCLKKKKQKN